MTLAVIGINHRTAPLEIREKLALGAGDLPNALRALCGLGGVREAAILSTCNRTEMYCDLGAAAATPPDRWLIEYHGLPYENFAGYFFSHPEADSVQHVMRVAAGLDSMVLGEPQILGQLKRAYRAAVESGTVGKLLNRLFQHSFFVAKKIRTDTAIGSSPVSVAFAAVRLAQQIHGSLRDKTALLIGAGDTIELAANHLYRNQLGRLIVANRSLDRAQLIASRYAGFAIPLADTTSHLAEADIVISATGSRHPILGKGAVERALRARKHRPMFMADIAVPRDIEPEIGELDDVYLYAVDDLQGIIDDNLRTRRFAAVQADEIIVTQSKHFIDWLRSNDAAATIRAMRGRTEALRRMVLDSARRRLRRGEDPEEVLALTTHKLVNRLLHDPSVSLREAGAEGRTEMIEAFRELFNLDDG
jgi:glutamyl-tRNA reductase